MGLTKQAQNPAFPDAVQQDTLPEIADNVQAADNPPIEAPAISGPRITITLEALLYLALIVFSLVIRLPELNTIPLNDAEAHEALAVYRIIEPRAPGSHLTTHNPLMFSANVLTMSIAGTDNSTARLPTVIVGVVVIVLPLLFRRWLGAANVLIVSALLAISPVLLTASRTMSGSVWSIALAIGAAYCIGRFIETRRLAFALTATTAAVMLVLMAEPAGFLTFLGITFGLIFAILTTDDPDRRERYIIRETLAHWPWLRSLFFAALAVGAVGTVFMLFPQGLGGIGELLGQSIQGFVVRPANYPVVYPLFASLFYEPLLWVFGIAGAYLVITSEPLTPERQLIHRVLVGWLIASVAFALIYQGAGSDHALWFTIPLVGLAALTVERAIAPVQDRFFNVPVWGPWLHGLAVLAMLAIAGINLLTIGRTFGTTTVAMVFHLPEEFAAQLFVIALVAVLTAVVYIFVTAVWGTGGARYALILGGVIIAFLILRALIQTINTEALAQVNSQQWVKLMMIGLSVALVAITFFLVGSVWGARASWHGLALGILLFLSIYGLSNGWRSSVMSAEDARDPWRIHPPSYNLNLVEDTLKRASLRYTGMPYNMSLVVQLPPSGSDDIPLAWSLRRFLDTKFVTELAPTTNSPAIVAVQTPDPPKLTLGYVGQQFPVSYIWNRGSLTPWDIIPWLYDRQTHVESQADLHMVIWLRSDVYGLESTAPSTSKQSPGFIPPAPQ